MRKMGMSIGVIVAISILGLASAVLPVVHGSTIPETLSRDQKQSQNYQLLKNSKLARENILLLIQKLRKNHDGGFNSNVIQNVISKEGKNQNLYLYGLTELIRVIAALILLIPTVIFVPFGIVMAVAAYIVSLAINVNLLWEIAIALLAPFVTCLVVLDYTGTLSFTAAHILAVAIIRSYLPIP